MKARLRFKSLQGFTQYMSVNHMSKGNNMILNKIGDGDDPDLARVFTWVLCSLKYPQK